MGWGAAVREARNERVGSEAEQPGQQPGAAAPRHGLLKGFHDSTVTSWQNCCCLDPCAPLHTATEAARASAPLPPESLHMDFILATLSEVASALQYLHAQVGAWGEGREGP